MCELSGLLFDYQNSVKDPYTNESPFVRGRKDGLAG